MGTRNEHVEHSPGISFPCQCRILSQFLRETYLVRFFWCVCWLCRDIADDMSWKWKYKERKIPWNFISSPVTNSLLIFSGKTYLMGLFFSFFGHGPLRMICRGNENTRKENRDADSMEMPPTNKQEGEIEREIRNRRTGDGETEKRDSYHFDFADWLILRQIRSQAVKEARLGFERDGGKGAGTRETLLGFWVSAEEWGLKKKFPVYFFFNKTAPILFYFFKKVPCSLNFYFFKKLYKNLTILFLLFNFYFWPI